MTEVKIDKVLVPKTACRCGGEFFVATVEGEERPRIFHTNLVCERVSKYSGTDFLKWVRTGEEPPAAIAPNRRMRRRMAALKRQA